MLRIDVADFHDKDAFDLDLKTNRAGLNFKGALRNSISIQLTSTSQSHVSRCLDYTRPSLIQETPMRHSRRPRRAYPTVKPCRPCRVGRTTP